MKKFIGAICSGIAGILTFVWLSLDWFVVKTTAGVDYREAVKGWELIADKEGMYAKVFEGAYTLYKVFAILMLVLACLLIVSAVVMLLKNLNVIKCKFNLSIINNILLTVFVVAVIGALAGVAVMGNEYFKAVGKPEDAYMGASVGAWIALAVSVVACGCGWALARKDK